MTYKQFRTIMFVVMTLGMSAIFSLARKESFKQYCFRVVTLGCVVTLIDLLMQDV